MRLGYLLLVVLHVVQYQKKDILSAFASDLPNESNLHGTYELNRSLFSYREDPLAEFDRWSALSQNVRSEWTASHQVINRAIGIRDVLRVTKDLRDTGTSVDIHVQIIAPDNLFSAHHKSRIKSYGHIARPSHHGTTLHFNVTLAGQPVYRRVAMLVSSQGVDNLMKYLEQVAPTSGSANVLFVVLTSNEPKENGQDKTLFVGAGKVACKLFSVDETSPDIADLLRTIEAVTEKVFHPFPLFFPVSVVQDLKVELIAYTPGRDRKAQWLEDFAWGQFEASLRSLVLHGQRLRFSSLQVNADCLLCGQAFSGIENPSRSFLKKAAAMLSRDSESARSWIANAKVDSLEWLAVGKSLRLYVIDTYMIHPGIALERLERSPLSLFPGMAIIMVRSSNNSSIAALQTLLACGYLGSALGVGNPEMYMSKTVGTTQRVVEAEASSVVFDISSRRIIRSIYERRAREVEDIARSILYFDVDPAQALGESEYAFFWERMNLILFKLTEAQKKAGVSNELPAALHLAFSTQHDVKSLRASFGIAENSKTVEKLRDPTLRCHFSRLKRETLRASRVLESKHPSVRQTLLALSSLSGAAALWWVILEQKLRVRAQRKSD